MRVWLLHLFDCRKIGRNTKRTAYTALTQVFEKKSEGVKWLEETFFCQVESGSKHYFYTISKNHWVEASLTQQDFGYYILPDHWPELAKSF